MRSRVVWTFHPREILNIPDGVQDGCVKGLNFEKFVLFQCFVLYSDNVLTKMYVLMSNGFKGKGSRSIGCTVAMVTSKIATIAFF